MKAVIFILFALLVFTNAQKLSEDHIKVLKILSRVDINKVMYDTMQEIKAGVNQYLEKFEGSEMVNLSKERIVKRNTPTNCSSALTNLGSVLATSSPCYSAVGPLLSGLSQAGSLTQSTLSTFCTSCHGQIAQALGYVGQYCPGASRLCGLFYEATAINNFLCSQDQNGNYCLLTLIQSANTLQSASFTTVTTSQLNTICAPCNIIAVKALAAAGLINIPTALKALYALRALCVQLNGQYCVISIQNSLSNAQSALTTLESGQQPTNSQFNTLMNAFCNPCVGLFFYRLTVSCPNQVQALAASTVISTIGSLCRKDLSGNYCVLDILNNDPTAILAALGGNNPCSNITSTTCPTLCSNLINGLVQNTGCCWGLAADLGGVNASYALTAFKPCFSNPSTVPPPCPSYSNATITITYGNINATWLANAANAAKFFAAVAADVSFACAAKFIFGGFQTSKKRTGQVTVTGSVCSGASNAIALTNANTDFGCENVCANVDGALNASQPISTSASVTSVNYQSSAPLFAFSALLFLLASLLVFLF